MEVLMNNKMNGEWTRELGNLSLGITVGMRADGQGSVFQFNEDRFRHMLVIGRTGSGKSNHILQMEREDILSGAGVAIIAAHEEDAIYPLTFVPEERMDDVVLIDASNKRYLPRMNPLDVDRNDKVAVDKAIDDVVELLKTGE
jgi:DNA helicase HerA-like ATPase